MERKSIAEGDLATTYIGDTEVTVKDAVLLLMALICVVSDFDEDGNIDATGLPVYLASQVLSAYTALYDFWS